MSSIEIWIGEMGPGVLNERVEGGRMGFLRFCRNEGVDSCSDRWERFGWTIAKDMTHPRSRYAFHVDIFTLGVEVGHEIASVSPMIWSWVLQDPDLPKPEGAIFFPTRSGLSLFDQEMKRTDHAAWAIETARQWWSGIQEKDRKIFRKCPPRGHGEKRRGNPIGYKGTLRQSRILTRLGRLMLILWDPDSESWYRSPLGDRLMALPGVEECENG